MNSDYTIAIHSLVLLAYLSDHMASSEEIAENISTHPARVRKIMSCLKKEGFIQTKEGVGGGYSLNCDPQEITLGEIFRLISSGTLQPKWCSGDPDEQCMVSSHFQEVMSTIYTGAEQQVQRYLHSMSIQDVLEQIITMKQPQG